MTPRTSAVAGLAIGLVAVGAAAVSGLAGDALTALVSPPALIRAGLVATMVVAGVGILARALRWIDSTPDPSASSQPASLGPMVRGIRLVFLAAAAFSAALGWLVGNALPIVIALVIAGVDVAETSFLLLVASARDEARG